jgi:predicted amidohydrolase
VLGIGAGIDILDENVAALQVALDAREKVAEADRTQETVLVAEFDLDATAEQRIEWGIFRDRRPDLYKAILTYDGEA